MISEKSYQDALDKIAQLEKQVSILQSKEINLKKEMEFINEVLYWIDSLVVVIDLNGFILTFNRASEQLSGYNYEEVRDRPFWDILLLPEERSEVKAAIEDVVNNELPKTNQNFWLTKDGKRRLISWVNSLLRKSDGSIEYILCTGLDITERKKAEEAIRKSEKRYRDLVQNANSIILRLDPRGRFIFFNEYAEKFFGYTEKEVIGKNTVGTILPERDSYGKDLSDLIEKMIKNPESYASHENENMCKNGDRVWVSWTNKAIYDDKGKISEFLCIGNDITEQKRLENQLQHAQRMEALGTLAGGVAHDLNNILSGLVSYPELILLDIPEFSPLKEPILRIQESGLKAAAIVQDLLTLARRGVTINEVVNINDIVTDYIETPEYKRLKKAYSQADISIDLDPDLLNILGSPVHLSKTIMNLISNAMEAIPTIGGTVTIATENQYIDKPIKGYEDVVEGDYAVLTIKDTGTGISSEDLPRIFEPFFTKKVMGRSGTGLGMAVVWGTVKDHNGYIDVQSRIGKGTTCQLYFPITRRNKTDMESNISIDDYCGDESILVVDDIEDQREIARQILLKLGYTVFTAAGGEEAVAYLKENKVDLVILDMIMNPGMDGLETYKEIIKIHPKQKAIITSGFSETERVKETIRLGAGAYIKKPYVLNKIGQAVRAELNSSR